VVHQEDTVQVCTGMARTKEETTGLTETMTTMDITIIIIIISMEDLQETTLEIIIMIISRKEEEKLNQASINVREKIFKF